MARPTSDVDLRRMDAGSTPKRKRKRADRKKPDPSPILKANEPEARAFVEGLPINPGVILEARGERDQLQSPHSDAELWNLQLAQAFGTRSNSLLDTFLHQLSRLCPQSWDEDVRRWRIDETEWNALVALVADWRPDNSAQAALAAQMAATHMMIMRLSAQALNRGHMILEKDAALASKLARTFTMQCEAMQALKGRSRTANQSIHVVKETHQHVHYHEGGGRETDARPHGPHESGRTIEAGEAVWSESPIRQALPSSSRTWKDTVPVPRSKGRRAEG